MFIIGAEFSLIVETWYKPREQSNILFGNACLDRGEFEREKLPPYFYILLRQGEWEHTKHKPPNPKPDLKHRHHPTKTKELLICFAKIPPNVPHITIDGSPIDRVNECKLLGLIINDTLTWDGHINKLHKKASTKHRTLSKATVPSFYYAFLMNTEYLFKNYCRARNTLRALCAFLLARH